MVSHAAGGSSARRRSDGRTGRRLVLLEGGRSSSSPSSHARALPPAEALDLQHDVLALITKYQTIDAELRARLPQDVMRLVDALADAARDIAMIEATLGDGPYS